MNTLVQGLFHLTSELADDAIGWVGGVGKQSIGKDTEGKVNSFFVAGGRMGAGGANKLMGSMAEKAGNKDGGGKGKGDGGTPGNLPTPGA